MERRMEAARFFGAFGIRRIRTGQAVSMEVANWE